MLRYVKGLKVLIVPQLGKNEDLRDRTTQSLYVARRRLLVVGVDVKPIFVVAGITSSSNNTDCCSYTMHIAFEVYWRTADCLVILYPLQDFQYFSSVDIIEV